MEVILLESLNNLGKAGEIVEVKDGFANNYLVPQRKALIANKKNKLELEMKMSQINSNHEKKLVEANQIKEQLDGKTIKISTEVNDDGKLYGNISQKLIVEEAKKQLDIELLTDNLIFSPIKNIGSHIIDVRLYDNVNSSITVEVQKLN